MGKYFKTDGVRGKVGEYPITPDFALKLGWAAGKVLAAEGNTRVLIGKDTRISGYMLESALEAGLASAGVDVELLGPMPTPAIAYLTRTFRAAAGIVISASHNPYDDNGIKLFSDTGHKLSDELEAAIEAKLDEPLTDISSNRMGRAFRVGDAPGRYIEFCKAIFPAELSLSGIRMVVDCANGANYYVGPAVFRELGAEVVAEVGTRPDGLNINKNCGATDLGALQLKVRETQADIGVAFDGDGDRLMVVAADGSVIDGDQIVYALTRQALEEGSLEGGVAGTLMTNMGLELALQQLGVPFTRTKVGDRHVMAALRSRRWQVGGESSGHIINLKYHSTGDGILAAVQFLSAMVRAGKSAQELVAGMEVMPQELVNVRYTPGTDPVNDASVQSVVAEVEAALGQQGRVLLRASGTEPLIRVMVEGREKRSVKAFARQIASEVEAVSELA